MKIMKIKIRSREESDKELKGLAKLLDKAEFNKIRPKKGIYFESLAAVRKILTDKRLDVWRAIRDESPESITELSEILDRGFRSVHRDVALLESLGIIKLVEKPGKRGNVQKLFSLYDKIELAVA